MFQRNLELGHVPKHRVRITLERIAESAARGQPDLPLITRLHRRGGGEERSGEKPAAPRLNRGVREKMGVPCIGSKTSAFSPATAVMSKT